ncbi:MAG: transposase [Deltaproteobacteria bacterium]|nr:transposase [Deltaproteobacteria bacterium]
MSLYHWSRVDRRTSGTAGAQNSAGFGRRCKNRASLCFASCGFSLHAARRIAAGNRQGLESLCDYVARPPLAAGSLQRISDEELTANNDWTNSSTRPEKYRRLDFSDNGFLKTKNTFVAMKAPD